LFQLNPSFEKKTCYYFEASQLFFVTSYEHSLYGCVSVSATTLAGHFVRSALKTSVPALEVDLEIRETF
jgi:hypothetical protein